MRINHHIQFPDQEVKPIDRGISESGVKHRFADYLYGEIKPDDPTEIKFTVEKETLLNVFKDIVEGKKLYESVESQKFQSHRDKGDRVCFKGNENIGIALDPNTIKPQISLADQLKKLTSILSTKEN